jgi:hypothetical protein
MTNVQKVTAPVESVAALRIAMQVQVGEQRVMTMETYVPVDEPLTQINALTDKLMSVAGHQETVSKIAALDAHIEEQKRRHTAAIQTVGALDEAHEQAFKAVAETSGRRNQTFKRTPAQDKERKNALTNVEQTRRLIADLQAKRDKLAHGGDTDSSADSHAGHAGG